MRIFGKPPDIGAIAMELMTAERSMRETTLFEQINARIRYITGGSRDTLKRAKFDAFIKTLMQKPNPKVKAIDGWYQLPEVPEFPSKAERWKRRGALKLRIYNEHEVENAA